MNNIPRKLRTQLAADPFYHVCARAGRHGHECAGRVTWEHAFIHAGKQLQSAAAIVPLCAKAHSVDAWQDRGDLNKEINQWIALNRMEDDEVLAISKARDYFLHRAYLNKKYGAYEAPRVPTISGIAYPWLREAAVIAGIFLMSALPTATHASINPAIVLTKVNTMRSLYGLAPLRESLKLHAAASAKADDEATHDYFAHVSPTGKLPWNFIAETGYVYTYAGENLAVDFDSEDALIAAWMASPAHAKNILSAHYTETGIAIASVFVTGSAADATEKVYVVEMFATPKGSETASAQVSATSTTKMPPHATTSINVATSTGTIVIPVGKGDVGKSDWVAGTVTFLVVVGLIFAITR